MGRVPLGRSCILSAPTGGGQQAVCRASALSWKLVHRVGSWHEWSSNSSVTASGHHLYFGRTNQQKRLLCKLYTNFQHPSDFPSWGLILAPELIFRPELGVGQNLSEFWSGCSELRSSFVRAGAASSTKADGEFRPTRPTGGPRLLPARFRPDPTYLSSLKSQELEF